MRKLTVLTLTAALLAGILTGCSKKNNSETTPTDTPTPTIVATATVAPTEEPAITEEPVSNLPELEANTVFDAFDEFDVTNAIGDNGPWIYSFTTDNGATFDPCTILESTDGLQPWHPWGGNWTGVGLNADASNYVELNTDSKDGINGALGFVAPADGTYGIAGAGMNMWDQPADLLYCVVNGAEIFTLELGIPETGANRFPYSTISLNAGDTIYFYCPSTEVDGWVSAYIRVKIAYEPSAEPEVYVEDPVVQADAVVFEVPEGAYYCVDEFDQTSATGENGVWLYSYTADGGATFNPCTILEPFDAFIPWHPTSGDYTGVGINPDVNDRLELNTSGLMANCGALGFKAPSAGDYTITGVVGNPWNQTADVLHASLNGEDLFTVMPGGSSDGDTLFPETTVSLNEGDIIYFYCPSTAEDSWVSAYVAIAVKLAE